MFGLRLRQTEGLLISVLQLMGLALTVPDHTTLSRRASTRRSPDDQVDVSIGQFTADGAYDGKPTYDAVSNHTADAVIVVLPRANAVDGSDTRPSNQRNRHIAAINTDGRMR